MAAPRLQPERQEPFMHNAFRSHISDQAGVLAQWKLGVPIKFGADVEIYGEGEPVDHVYEVVEGAVQPENIAGWTSADRRLLFCRRYLRS